MTHRAKVLAVNVSDPVCDHLAISAEECGLLDRFVRPYTYQGRLWEDIVAALPLFGRDLQRSFGRRILPVPLPSNRISEVALPHDFGLALVSRSGPQTTFTLSVRRTLMHARTRAVARAAAHLLDGQKAVIASWGCGELAFERVKDEGGICVLNYPFAHHRRARELLLEEAAREPAFAGTLNSHERPRWLEDRLDREIDLADHVLVGSSFARDSFVASGVEPRKVEVIPYGADPRLFSAGGPRQATGDRFAVLFVGQIGQRKGLSYLLRSYRRFMGPGTSLTLVGKIQGDGSALEPFEATFRHVDHVPRRELTDIYARSDVFLFPTIVEGMPLVVLEAMASGLPVITTPNGPGDLVRDGVDGFVVPIRDEEAIVDRLERLRKDPALRSELGKNARERALRFTWERFRREVALRLQDWLCA